MIMAARLAPAQLRISEFMADNSSVLQDEDCDYSDWLEIYNAGSTAVNLSGWHLTDTPTNRTRWTFPPTPLPAGGFLVVFASGKNRTGPHLHANFSLTAEGETLALVRPDGTTIEHEYVSVPMQFPDISYGIQTHGTNPTLRTGQPGYLIVHTPGASNSCLPAPHPLYSDHSVAQIDIAISQNDWDGLMNSPWDESFRPVNLRFRHGDIDLAVTNAGIKCRGASTREHQPRAFTLSFNAFVPGQKMLDLERLHLNSTPVDPSSMRSKLVHDLHAAAGLPIPYVNQVALVVHGPDWDRTNWVGGVFFDAIRNNTQPVDDVFLRQRFGNARGNLYKDTASAPLTYLGPHGSSYTNSTYELQYAGNGDTSFNDLADFIATINQTPDADFPNAIMQVFDVDGFLKCLALDVLTANYDSYWIYGHNYQLYLHPDTHRWVYVPYDFDLTFGISWGGTVNWALQYIYSWTNVSGACATPLASRIFAVPEFRSRYSFYMKQMLDTSYTNSSLAPGLFHCRAAMTRALPFQDSVSVTNLKAQERLRYAGDWPNWSYTQFWNSYENDQTAWDVGLTSFIGTRNASARSQLARGFSIGPILSDFALSPRQPGTNDPMSISIQAQDDVSVATVTFYYSFQGGDTHPVAMTRQSDGSYAATLPAFGSTGTLRYLVRAVDNIGKVTFHPYGGSNYTASAQIGNWTSQLVVTELNYNPYDLTPAEITAGLSDPRSLEFVELHNAGAGPLDLAGYKLTDGIGATFPACVLGAGNYAVVANDTNAFRIRYADPSIQIIGAFQSGNLSNSRDTLRLEDPQGLVLASITYDDGGDWPNRADGHGSSLELINPALGYADPTHWRSSSEYGGSPGTAGLGPDNRIVINEVLSHADSPLSDCIELYNTTDEAMAIGGWFLSNAQSNYCKFILPANTILPARGYAVFDAVHHFNTSGGTDTNDFSLDGAHGDNVYLLSTDAQGNLARFMDRVEFGAAANGESFGRWPNGMGRLYPMLSHTPNLPNSGPRVGPLIISELMYHPPSGSNHLEFIEIANPSPDPVELSRWQLDGGITFTFSHATLPAGDALALLSFDPNLAMNSTLLADFKSVYGITNDILFAGPYAESLSDEGARIRLLRPDAPPADEPDYDPLLIEDEVQYGHDSSWPLAPNGEGASLDRRIPAAWGDDPSAWTAAISPTPGEARPSPTAFQAWAAHNGIDDLCAINPASGVSFAEEFLLATSAVHSLHSQGLSLGFPSYTHVPMLNHGIHARIEISTNLNNPAWREPSRSELIFLSNQTYRIGATGTPIFIRLQLIPLP